MFLLHFLGLGHIRVKILPPIATDGYSADNIQELIDKTYKVISENVDLISKEEDDKMKKD